MGIYTNLESALEQCKKPVPVRQSGDCEKLLFVIQTADVDQIPIDKTNIHPYFFLLKFEDTLKFQYRFSLKPLPYSDQLDDDIFDMVSIEYLRSQSPIHITGLGEEWVQQYLQPDEQLRAAVSAKLRRYDQMTDEEMHDTLYHAVSATASAAL